jgi:hypothetical protein
MMRRFYLPLLAAGIAGFLSPPSRCLAADSGFRGGTAVVTNAPIPPPLLEIHPPSSTNVVFITNTVPPQLARFDLPLQTSTNLVDWTNETVRIYITADRDRKFFKIHTPTNEATGE